MSKANALKGLAAVAALATVAAVYAQGVLLARKLSPDSTEKYQVTMKVATVVELPNGMGEQEMSADILQTLSLKMGKMTPKGLEVEATTTYEKMKVASMMGDEEELPKPLTRKGTMDKQGRIAYAGPAATSAMQAAMDGSFVNAIANPFIELPNKAVKIGDTWQIAIPKGPMTKTPQSVQATIVGEEDFEGQPAYKVALAGQIKLDMGTFPLPKELPGGQPNPLAGQKMSVKADLEVKGFGFVDKVTGRTLSAETTTKSKQAMSVVDLGMAMNSTSDMKMTVKGL